MWEVTLVADGGMSGEGERVKRRTVVVLKESIGDANESALLKGDAIVVGEDAIRGRGRRTCCWRGVSGRETRRRVVRTREEVTDVGDGLYVLEKEVVEDAGGGVEGIEVDEGREGGACLRHWGHVRGPTSTGFCNDAL